MNVPEENPSHQPVSCQLLAVAQRSFNLRQKFELKNYIQILENLLPDSTAVFMGSAVTMCVCVCESCDSAHRVMALKHP